MLHAFMYASIIACNTIEEPSHLNNTDINILFTESCGVGGAILQSCITDWPCVVGSPTFADIL